MSGRVTSRTPGVLMALAALTLLAMGAGLTGLTLARALPGLAVNPPGVSLGLVLLAVLLGLPFASTGAALIGAARRGLRVRH